MTSAASKPLRIFLVAGEASGDVIGGHLMRSLREEVGVRKVEFSGVGGALMEREGLRSLFPMTDLSVLGLTELISSLPTLAYRLRQTVKEVVATRPDAVVTIDAKGFSFRLLSRIQANLGAARPALVQYVAPSVWAYKGASATHWSGVVDEMLALFPFEERFLRSQGIPCTVVGHPVVQGALGPQHRSATSRDAQTLRRECDAPLVALLPGSRPNEVSRSLPVFLRALSLVPTAPHLDVVVVTIPAVSSLVRPHLASFPNVRLIDTDDEHQRAAALMAADVALAVSGSVTLELALASVPAVVCYAANRLTGFIARRKAAVRWVSLPSILLDERVFPELLFDEFRAETVARELRALLSDEQARRTQQMTLRRVEERLSVGLEPSAIAARAVLATIERRRKATG